MENKKNIRDESSSQNGLLIDEEKTEDIAEQIQDLVEKDERPAAVELFSQLRPGDQGEVMDDLPLETRQEMLKALPPEEAAEILEHLEPGDAAEVSEGVDSSVLSDILDEADSDVAADILRQLPEEHALDVLGEMEEAADIIPVLQYPDDSAGGRMVVEFVFVKDDATAAVALDTLRKQEPEQVKDIRSVFVTDAEGRLAGELSVARLALAGPGTKVRNIMETDIVSVAVDTNQEECARVMERYNLDQLPVVDAARQLVGVIMSEDIIDVIEEEATEDIYRLAGIPGERVFGSLILSMRNRLPWLSLNLVTLFLAALVISTFESTIAQFVTLAVFLPIVAGQGGIGGTQTLTLVVRSIALGEVSKKGGLRLLRREVILGLIHGLLLGVVVGLIAYFWKGNYMLGVVLGMAMIGNMIIAGLAGAGIPLVLTRLRVDPAVASAVIVTTCTDVIGFLLFLGLATALVTFLV
ncbi:MAG: magnesium transporter [Dehalococcoidales bacterium]|nr:magnesium transporter [Dehalococcoidales bacterium]